MTPLASQNKVCADCKNQVNDCENDNSFYETFRIRQTSARCKLGARLKRHVNDYIRQDAKRKPLQTVQFQNHPGQCSREEIAGENTHEEKIIGICMGEIHKGRYYHPFSTGVRFGRSSIGRDIRG